MDIRQTLRDYVLKPIVYTGLIGCIGLSGCDKKEPKIVKSIEQVKPIETINGRVIKENYLEVEEVVGIFGKAKVKDLRNDEYRMIVESDDKRQFCYTFTGAEARNMNMIYDVNSTIKKFPTTSLGLCDDSFRDDEETRSREKLRKELGMGYVSVRKID
ncbi:MAG: hypothetical protein AABW67_05515 [Nanoarchaeota archaeon]